MLWDFSSIKIKPSQFLCYKSTQKEICFKLMMKHVESYIMMHLQLWWTFEKGLFFSVFRWIRCCLYMTLMMDQVLWKKGQKQLKHTSWNATSIFEPSVSMLHDVDHRSTVGLYCNLRIIKIRNWLSFFNCYHGNSL